MRRKKFALLLAVAVSAVVAVTTAAATIMVVGGQVTKIPPPPSVMFGALQSDTTMFAFDEQQNVVLGQDVAVDITPPGLYSPSCLADPNCLTSGTIAAGTRVSSHFVHADPIDKDHVQLEGTVRTDFPILGIAVFDASLDHSDFLGAPGTVYPTGFGRGLNPNDKQNDFLIEEQDRETVVIHTDTRLHADQVRIITSSGSPCTGGSSISSNFNGTPIAAGNYIWFNSVVKASGLGSKPVTLRLDASTITFTANSVPYTLNVPNALITFDPAVTQATTTFDNGTNTWKTTVPSSGLAGNTFLSGLAFKVPTNFPGGIKPVTWNGTFTTDTPGISFQWKWGAAVYTSFSSDYNALGVKPVDDNKASQYKNSDHAGTPENFKSFVIGGARGGGGSNFTGSYSGTGSGQCP